MKRLNSTKAFTLIELIVVISVLGILVLLAAPRFIGQTDNALETSIIHDATLIQNATERYYIDNGELPFRYQEGIDGEQVKVEAGTPAQYEILYKIMDFDNDNPNVKFYEIDFRELDDYIKVNSDEGYFLAARGNPDFGVTVLKPGAESTVERLNNDESNSYRDHISVENNLDPKENGETIWNGLTPEAFDGDQSTFTRLSVDNPHEVTWEGDLTNNMITVVMANGRHWGSSPSATMTILDDEGNSIDFINADNDSIMTRFHISTHASSTRRTLNFIMPEDAHKLRFTTSGRTAGYVYELIDYEKKELPLPIMSMDAESTNDSVLLSWPSSDDVDKVVVYRDDKFIGYSDNNEYNDTPVYSDKTYTYTLQTIDEFGNRSEKTHYRTKTQKPEIVWRGLAPGAFDEDGNTHARLSTDEEYYATWEGKLIGEEVTVVMANAYHWGSSPSATMKIYDKEDNQLDFLNSDTNNMMNEFEISVHSNSTRRTLNFIMPDGAEKIGFSSRGAEAGYVYTVEINKD